TGPVGARARGLVALVAGDDVPPPSPAFLSICPHALPVGTSHLPGDGVHAASSCCGTAPFRDRLLAAAQQRLGELPHHIADRAGVHVGLGDGDLVSGAADDLIEHLDVGAQHFLDGVVQGAGGDHGRDHHGAVLTYAVLAVLGLGDQV